MTTQRLDIMPHQARSLRIHGSRHPLRGIAFDLDSTLTRPYLDFTRLRQQLNLPEGDILQWLDGLPPQQRRQASHIIEAFEQDGVENVTWNEGAQETVAAVQAMGLRTAIVTRNSRSSLLAVCSRLEITVDHLVAREDATPKPHPACLHYTAAKLTVPVEQLLMVGDYRHDTDAGKAAGAMTALLTNGRAPTWTVTADLVIERLPELLTHIE
jgi:HAD superfamily hydrolase (TIGR01509 family)